MNEPPLTSLRSAVLARARELAVAGLLHCEILDVLDHEYVDRAWSGLVWWAADMACLERFRLKVEATAV